jgi:Bifunctional DNA primase/polymerase, N-terminal
MSGVQLVSAEEITNELNSVLEHALYYAETLGWVVFPAPQGERKSHKSAKYSGGREWGKTKDPDEIRADFARWPDANVGIPTGSENRFWVLDVDSIAGHGVDGFASVAALEAEHGKLPDTLQAESPSGGVHYLFNQPKDVEIRNSVGQIGPGIDVRGEGGMIIAPPSVKPGKGVYVWRNSLSIADAPEWLIKLVVEASKTKTSGAPTTEQVERVIPIRPQAGSYAERVLNAEYERVANAGDGGRNHQLNKSALVVGKWVGNGELSEEIAVQTMLEACAVNKLLEDDGENACLATIRSGLTKGKTEPAISSKQMFKDIPAMVAQIAAAAGATLAPPPPIDAPPIPEEILERMRLEREQHAMAALGPMPEHSNLTMEQAHGLAAYWCHLPTGKIICERTGELHSPTSMDKHFPKIKDAMKTEGPGMNASTWWARYRVVNSMGWAPGEPKIIEDKVLTQDGWIPYAGRKTFNFYIAPTLERIEGDVSKWVDHIRFIYPEEAEQIIAYLAYEKHVAQYAALNVNGTILTSNHPDALYLSPDDRRHYVCISSRNKMDFAAGYFDEINNWFENGGNEAVAHYLETLDLSKFNPKATPPKTTGWHRIVAGGLAPESSDMKDVIEVMGRPRALTLEMVKARTPTDSQLRLAFEDRKQVKALSKRLAECSYTAVPNLDAPSDNRWRVGGRKTMVYALRELAEGERLDAARVLSATGATPLPTT